MNKEKRNFFISTILILLAVVFTILVKVVDVKQVGVNGTSIGFATVNQFVFLVYRSKYDMVSYYRLVRTSADFYGYGI